MIGAVVIVTALIAERAYFHTRFTDATTRLRTATALASEVLRLDDRLTLAAEMAVASGEPSWIVRYEADVPAMERSITEALALAPPDIARRFDTQTRTANDALLALAREAFSYLREGRRDEANLVLRSEVYAKNKHQLANGAAYLTTALIGTAEEQLSFLLLQAAGFVGTLLLVGFGGLWGVLWRGLSRSENGFLVAEHKLGQANATLDATNRALASQSARAEESARLLRLAQDTAGAGLWEIDLVRRRVRLSPESLRMHGIDPVGRGSDGSMELDESDWAAHVHPDDLIRIGPELERAVSSGRTSVVEFRARGSSGPDPTPENDDWRWIWGFGRAVNDPTTGKPERMVGLNLDITDRKRVEDALRASRERLRVSEERLTLALDSGSDGLWDWTIPTGESWLSDRWVTMLGYEPGELEAHIRTWEGLVHPEDKPRAWELLTAHFEGRTEVYACEHRLRRKDGSWAWILARGKVVARDKEGQPLRIVGTHIDTTARRDAEREAEHLAHHDPLTGLPNRKRFQECLAGALLRANGGDRPCALLLVDLDRFKAVNDTLGHSAGDTLLTEVARRLLAAMGPDDVAARLGGDEFAVILAGGGRRAIEVGERLVAALHDPVYIDGGRRISVGASAGLAEAPADADGADALMQRADLALYRAKAQGRGRVQRYEPAMDRAREERRRLELDLRGALGRGEFVLHYQPIVAAADRRIVAREALIRWHHPERGLVAPDAFIPLAEETGLIVPMGAWVLREACREAASWSDASERIAVNLSAKQFGDEGLVTTAMSALASSGLAPDRLELEITETVLMTEENCRVMETLARLRDLGIRVALDDFGTGYSSLSYLRRFSFDKIKIDRSFVRHIEDPDTAAIVHAIVGLANRLGRAVTAEGVETEAQFTAVAALGCTEIQGYLTGGPAPPRSAFALLSKADAA
jgi:diguanylate cyclase (GGDEF)-like protein/PAS domain S-box-containing protein